MKVQASVRCERPEEWTDCSCVILFSPSSGLSFPQSSLFYHNDVICSLTRITNDLYDYNPYYAGKIHRILSKLYVILIVCCSQAEHKTASHKATLFLEYKSILLNGACSLKILATCTRL